MRKIRSHTGHAWMARVVASAVTILLSAPDPRCGAQCVPDTLKATIVNTGPTTTDQFGAAVAIDGNLVVIGAPNTDVGANTNVGVAYIRNATTGAPVATLNNPANTANQTFGAAVAIDGSLVVVGARLDASGGKAYLFNTSGDFVATLTNPNALTPAGDSFGSGVGISGSVVVVGALACDVGGVNAVGAAYVFNTSGVYQRTLSNPDPDLSDTFGRTVAVSGNLAVVGTSADDPGGVNNAGTAYVFNVTTGALVWTLNSPFPADSDSFGWSVEIDGNVAVVGAYLVDSGPTLSVGAAYLFNMNTGLLTRTLINPFPDASDNFGFSVSVSGNYILVGAYLDDAVQTDAGTAYVFDAISGSRLATLTKPSALTMDQFGFAVAISGSAAVVGANFDDTAGLNTGAALTFGCSPTPTPSLTFTPSLTPSPTPSPTVSPTPSFTPSETPSFTPSETPSSTPSETPSFTPSETPSFTPTLTPSETPSVTPTFTPSETPSVTPTFTPSHTPTSTPSPSPTPVIPVELSGVEID